MFEAQLKRKTLSGKSSCFNFFKNFSEFSKKRLMMELLFNKIVDLKSEISSNKIDLSQAAIFGHIFGNIFDESQENDVFRAIKRDQLH